MCAKVMVQRWARGGDESADWRDSGRGRYCAGRHSFDLVIVEIAFCIPMPCMAGFAGHGREAGHEVLDDRLGGGGSLDCMDAAGAIAEHRVDLLGAPLRASDSCDKAAGGDWAEGFQRRRSCCIDIGDPRGDRRRMVGWHPRCAGAGLDSSNGGAL